MIIVMIHDDREAFIIIIIIIIISMIIVIIHGDREAVAAVISRQRGGYIRVEYPLVGLDILFDFNYISMDVSSQCHMTHQYVREFTVSYNTSLWT